MNISTWTHGEGTWDKLGEERANIVNVSDRGAVQNTGFADVNKLRRTLYVVISKSMSGVVVSSVHQFKTKSPTYDSI